MKRNELIFVKQSEPCWPIGVCVAVIGRVTQVLRVLIRSQEAGSVTHGSLNLKFGTVPDRQKQLLFPLIDEESKLRETKKLAPKQHSAGTEVGFELHLKRSD